jgi:uncharacterized protein (TIGR02996 family)
VSDTVAGLLRCALESFERYEEEAALQRLLEAWRESRAERLALLAERLSAMDAQRPVPHVGLRGLPRKLDLLVEHVRDRSAHDVRQELRELLEWPPDPRLTHGLLRLPARDLPADVLLPLCALLEHVKDPRALGPLRTRHASLPPGGWAAHRLGIAIGHIAGQPVSELGAEALPLCQALEEAIHRREEALTRSAPLWESLLEHVLSHPDDDGARLVLADHLLDQGDTLGELISLQCQPDAARAGLVLGPHQERWEALLGFGVVPGGAHLERGFPHAVRMRLETGQHLPPPTWPWRTVREIDWSGTGDESEADWLAHPHLGGATVLRQVPASLARQLGRHPLPVRRLGLRVEHERDSEEVFTSLAALPRLVWLEVSCAQAGVVRRCVESPLAGRLERLELSYHGGMSLKVVPKAQVPVEATLEHPDSARALMDALLAATRFGTRVIRIRVPRKLHPRNERRLRRAMALYTRVEWSHPPG